MFNQNPRSGTKLLAVCVHIFTVSAFVVLLPLANAYSQDSSAGIIAPADNTTINQRDRSSDQLTADQASQHLSDRDIMRKIRRSVVKDKSLSTYAHNIKIISQNGTVTLKGPVRSDDEKKNIIAKATSVAGENNVVDQLSIRPSSDQN